MGDVAIIVPTLRRPDSLTRALRSLFAQSGVGDRVSEIVVVDNAPSSSQTADLIARRYGGARAVRYVREDVPGLGRAHNAGLANLSSELALFTDDDVVVDPNWVAAMAARSRPWVARWRVATSATGSTAIMSGARW